MATKKNKKIEADPVKLKGLEEAFVDAEMGSRIVPPDDFNTIAEDCQQGKNIAMTQLSILRELHLIRKMLEARNGK